MSKYLQSLIDRRVEALKNVEALEQAPDENPLIRRAWQEIDFAQSMLDRGLVKTDGTTDKAMRIAFGSHLHVVEQSVMMVRAQPKLIKELKRQANLPNATERYARWRELAQQIAKEKPFIKSKAEIARQVRVRLLNSHDERDQEFIKSANTIRRAI